MAKVSMSYIANCQRNYAYVCHFLNSQVNQKMNKNMSQVWYPQFTMKWYTFNVSDNYKLLVSCTSTKRGLVCAGKYQSPANSDFNFAIVKNISQLLIATVCLLRSSLFDRVTMNNAVSSDCLCMLCAWG